MMLADLGLKTKVFMIDYDETIRIIFFNINNAVIVYNWNYSFGITYVCLMFAGTHQGQRQAPSHPTQLR